MKVKIAVALFLLLAFAAEAKAPERVTRWRIVVEFDVPKGYIAANEQIGLAQRDAMIAAGRLGEPRIVRLEGKTRAGWGGGNSMN